jgi:hypothetical protein
VFLALLFLFSWIALTISDMIPSNVINNMYGLMKQYGAENKSRTHVIAVDM